MNSITIYWSLALAALFSLSSCEDFFETTIDLPPPEHSPQIVVSAFNQTPTLITALVTQSVSLSENPFADNTFLWGAQISVFQNNNYLGDMEQVGDADQFVEQYNYQFNLSEPLAPNTTYRLDISYPNLPDATVTTTMPTAPPVLSVDYEENGGVTADGFDSSAIDVELSDEAGVEAFYEVSAVNSFDNTFENGYQMYLQSTDPSTSRSLEWNWLLISDSSFDGSDKIVRLQTDPLDSKSEGSVFLTVSTITKAQYEYSKAYRQQLDVGDNPFASPVQIPTSVDGGFGFFGLRNSRIYEIEF